MKNYLKAVLLALKGKPVIVTQVAPPITKELATLDKLFPIKLHEKGMSIEDHARQAGEQNVIAVLRRRYGL